jgi:hypothetical protein
MCVDLTLRGIKSSSVRLFPDRELDFEFGDPGLQFYISFDRHRGEV